MTSKQIVAVLERAADITEDEQARYDEACVLTYTADPELWETDRRAAESVPPMDDGSWRELWDAWEDESKPKRRARVQDNTRTVVSVLRAGKGLDKDARARLLTPWVDTFGAIK